MRPKSDLISGESGRIAQVSRASLGPARMASADRREMILDRAAEFFSEYGLTAQTRGLARATGVAQRLLYRYFPSKADLLKEVYQHAIVEPFKAIWLAQLEDRSRPIEERLTSFYSHYFRTVLTRRWLRLFLYASLGDTDVAPSYIQSVITRLLTVIAVESAYEQGVALPIDDRAVRQIAWILHGSISHVAIRQHIYGARRELPEADVIALHVRSFLSGFKGTVEHARALTKNDAA